MAANNELHSALLELQKNASRLPTEDALALIDTRIQSTEQHEFITEFTVLKASILRGDGRLEEAAHLLRENYNIHANSDSYNYFLGEYSIELQSFKDALKYLSKCIEISKSTSESWYQDAAYLLRAYCNAKLGRSNDASADLLHASEDESMEWIEAVPPITKANIKAMICN
jgi:tetratricopeptide (TPR) repeat protein